MKYKEAMKTWSRMCHTYKNTCSLCELSKISTGSHLLCYEFVMHETDSAEAIFYAWNKMHPQDTPLIQLRRSFPSTVVDIKGNPNFCPSELGYGVLEDCENENGDILCEVCWNRHVNDEISPKIA